MISAHILKLPTPRLLAYYKKHYRGQSPYTDYWGQVEEREADQHAEYEAEREALKKELGNREHVE